MDGCMGPPSGPDGISAKLRGPKGHINIRIPQSGSEAQRSGISETMLSRILVLLWSFGPLEFMNCSRATLCNLSLKSLAIIPGRCAAGH